MSTIVVALLIASIGGPVEAPAIMGFQLAQSTHPGLAPPPRFGRSYAPPEQSNPGTSGGPLLTPPVPRPSGRRERTGTPPTANDCTTGYSSRSGLTRREFNRLCGRSS